MARGLLGRTFVLFRAMWGVVATCIFASILQSKAPAYRRSGKNPCSSMLFANNRRGYGPTALDLQGYSRSLAFVMAPDALGYVEYSQKCTAEHDPPGQSAQVRYSGTPANSQYIQVTAPVTVERAKSTVHPMVVR